MTPQEFFAALRKHRDEFKWFLANDDRSIQAHAKGVAQVFDPLTALVYATRGQTLRLAQPMLAGNEILGLDYEFTYQIMLAGSIPSHDMRSRLMMACGLMEDTGDEQFEVEAGSLFAKSG